MHAEERYQLRKEQDLYAALAHEVQAAIPHQEWQALIAFSTYCAGKLFLALEFYRRPNGRAAYRFRRQTRADALEMGEELVDDNL